MNKQFRVRKSTYYNEYGEESREYYYIQQLKSFLGIKYWRNIKHEVCYTSGCYKTTTQFNTYFEVYEFTVKLKTGLKASKWKEEVISYV